MQNIQLRREMLSISDHVLKQNPKNFDEIMIARLKWVEEEPRRPGLILLEDKLWQRSLAKSSGVSCPKLLTSFESDASEIDIRNALQSISGTVVIKPTHLLAGLGVIIVAPSGEVKFPPPSGPGCMKMEAWQNEHSCFSKPETTNSKEDNLCIVSGICMTMLKQKANESEAKPLRMIIPRLMIEEKVTIESEVRILTIFGKVVGAASDGNRNVPISIELEQAAIALAFEARADCFRCDFFLLKNDKFVLNECCSYLWPSDNFFSEGIYEQAYHDLLSNYYKIASPMVEIVSIDSYVYRVTQNYTSCAIGDAKYMTFSCHFYIVKGTKGVVLIDTGCGLDIASAINLIGCKLTPEDNKDLVCILTHWHDDHIYGLQNIKSEIRQKIRVIAHEPDVDKIKRSLSNSIQIDTISTGYKVCLENIELKIHHTPGHTKGSICIQTNKHHVFTGDAFIPGDDLMFISDEHAFVRCTNYYRSLVY